MSPIKILLRVAAAVVCLLVIGMPAKAQYRASVHGVVLDPSGGVVSDAKITITSQERGGSQFGMTDASGVYSIPQLAPGMYTVVVEKTGFKKKVFDSFEIVGEQVNSLDVTLDLGQVSETITVSGDATPTLDTDNASISGSVNATEIQKLPSFGRDPFQLLQLAPGAFGDGAQGGGGGTSNLPGTTIGGTGGTDGIFKTENGGQITANGARTGENNYTIDGVGMTSVTWGGTAVITPNEDSIKEVKIITDNYDAEYGRYRGAQVQIISQNGTNQYHGSLFFKAHRPGLNAYQKYNGYGNGLVRDQARFNDYGATIGGPILKNKLFVFFSYETIKNNQKSTDAGGWYETASYRGSAAAGSNAAKYFNFPGAAPVGGTVAEGAGDSHACADVGLVDGVNCVFIPGQGLDLGRPLNSSFALGAADPSWKLPVTNSSGVKTFFPGLGGDGTGGINNFDGVADVAFIQNIPNPSSSDQVQYNGRVDFNVTSKDLVAFSIYYVPVSSTSYNGNGVRAMNLFNHSVINEAFTGLWDHTFSPTLVNEVRINAAGWRWKDLDLNPQGPWGLSPFNFSDPFAGNVMSNAPPQTFGIGAPGTFDQWTYGVKDVATKVSGAHTIKFGGEFTRLLFVDNSPWNARPTYWFHSLWDFTNDAPSHEQATFNPVTGVPTDFRKDTRSNLYGFFFQDNIKVKSNFALTLGLRWELYGPISEKNGNLATVELGTGVNEFTGIRVRKGGTLYDPSLNNYGPQIGFAWSPKGVFSHELNNRFVLRGGFGIAYNGLDEAISLNGRSNPPFLSASGDLTGNQIVYANSFPSNVHSFYGYASNPAAIATFDPNTNLPVPGTANFAPVSLTGYPSNWPSTTSYHYTLQGEYDLGHQWVASVEYQGSSTRHLTQQYNLYTVAVAANSNIGLNPVVPGLNWYANDGSAHFNALLLELHHRFSSSFELDTQYRFSKSTDTGSNNYANGNYQYNIGTNLGPSDFDTRHAFKMWGVYSPNFFHGNGWQEKVLGGWTISGIMNWHTGFPFNPTYCGLPDAMFGGSSGYGGTNCYRPEAYLGGLNPDFRSSATNATGGGAFFTSPTVVTGPSFECVTTTTITANCPSGRVPYGPIPTAPGVGRNAFTGPKYFDVDATISKSFGLPRIPILGENAKFEFRTNFYNLFNKLNLTNIQTDVNNSHFGEAQNALGARVIEMQARFSF